MSAENLSTGIQEMTPFEHLLVKKLRALAIEEIEQLDRQEASGILGVTPKYLISLVRSNEWSLSRAIRILDCLGRVDLLPRAVQQTYWEYSKPNE